MKILHYIPERFHSIDINEAYISVLKDSVSRFAENEIASTYAEFIQKAETMQPEIIHIHACWNLSAYRVQHWAARNRKAIVLSPHKKMHPWHVNHHLFLHKLPLLIIYQRTAIKEADAVLSTTTTELKRMEKIGWNTRNVLIRDSACCGALTNDDMSAQLSRLYQKVTDSNSFRLMTAEDRELEKRMLRSALPGSISTADSPRYEPNEEHLRKILIHAGNEGVRAEVEKGAQKMGITLPDIKLSTDNGTIDTFPCRLPKNTEPVEWEKLKVKSRRKKTALANIMTDEKPTENELRICIMLANIEQELKNKTLSIKHLTEIFHALRFTEYDEDMVQRMFKQLGIKKFTSRLLQIMHETFGLEEGFMPISPVNDKKTESIRRRLSHINI